jgi:hypothetical protein
MSLCGFVQRPTGDAAFADGCEHGSTKLDAIPLDSDANMFRNDQRPKVHACCCSITQSCHVSKVCSSLPPAGLYTTQYTPSVIRPVINAKLQNSETAV